MTASDRFNITVTDDEPAGKIVGIDIDGERVITLLASEEGPVAGVLILDSNGNRVGMMLAVRKDALAEIVGKAREDFLRAMPMGGPVQ